MDEMIKNYNKAHNKSNRYEYIINSNDIYKAFIKSREDLNYSLKKERSRDRYVANRKGLEQAIIDSVNKVLTKEMEDIADVISQDVIYNIQSAFGNAQGGKSNKNTFGNRLGKMLGKALVDVPLKALDELKNDIT